MKLDTNVSLRIRGGGSAGLSLSLLVAIPAVCWGQSSLRSVDVLKADIDAVVAAPAGGADRQIKVVDVGKLNVGVGVLQVGRRPNDGGPVSGIAHTQVTEVYYVLSGSGVLITGTEIDGRPESLPADSEVVRVAVGPSHRATFMDGERRTVSAGDVVVIPAGVLHGWVEIPDHVKYLSIRPDPDRVLPAGYVNPALERPAR